MKVLPMRSQLVIGLFCVILCSWQSRDTLSQENNQAPDGFIAIFNGRNLDGWYGMGHFDPRKLAAMSDEERTNKRAADLKDMKKHWSVQNGELVNDGEGVYLTTDKEYEDFELWIDYKTVPQADSGIYLRANPQVQIWDWTKEGGKWYLGADLGSGGLWNNNPSNPGKNPLSRADNDFGQWNRFRIQQIGSRTSIWLNGRQVVDHAIMDNFWNRRRPHFAKGPIQLQTHGGEIRWRNVFLREISGEEANTILTSRSGEGFESIFNGKNFDGWAGLIENYEIKEDGVIMCKPHKGGTVYTKDEFGDFAVRLEFKLPPGGNNGLAIRYPGHGDAAYTSMCELQVLDSEHPKYAELDERQYHGSAYGMAPAHRGYLRSAGEWNFQEVTVTDSRIKVELNGTVILNSNLAAISDFMSNTPHPGKDLTRGHFGFAGHSDPVQYRNVNIKKLDDRSQRAESFSFSVPARFDYQLYLPEGYPTQDNWPLIIFLHGAGERGDTLDRVNTHGPPKVARDKNLPFVVVSPQCKSNVRWDPVSLNRLLTDVLKRYKVDKNRVYLTGLSMGGEGTWQWAAYAPYRFAAIAPICGKSDGGLAKRLSMPIWVFHGAQDDVVHLKHSYQMVNSVKKEGGDIRITVYPDAAHDSWTATYANPELYEWFLRHSR